MKNLTCCNNHDLVKIVIKSILEKRDINNYINYLNYIYEEQKEYFKNLFEKNILKLKKYKYIDQKIIEGIKYDTFKYKIIKVNEINYIIFDNQKAKIIDLSNEFNIYDVPKSCIFHNFYQLNFINKMQKVLIKYEKGFLNFCLKTPIYVVFDEIINFFIMISIFDLNDILSYKNLVFFFDIKEVDNFFNKPQAIIPDYYINIEQKGFQNINNINNYNSLTKILNEKKVYRAYKTKMLKQDIDLYYDNLSLNNIKDEVKKETKILFINSILPTALKNYLSDFADAAKNSNIKNMELVEEDFIYEINEYTFLKSLYEFKPNVIFCINKFRFECYYINPKIIFLTWMVDPCKKFFSKYNAENLKETDFILSMFIKDKDFYSKYDYKKIIHCSFGINKKIYKEITLNQEDLKKYSADICFTTSFANPYDVLEQYVLKPIKNLKQYDVIKNFFTDLTYQSINILNDNPYEEDALDEIFYETLRKYKLICLNIHEKDITHMLNIFKKYTIALAIRRYLPIHWLIEKKYNLKLWGKGFDKSEKLKKYHAGYIESREEMCKVYNATKIVVQSSVGVTLHERLFQSMCCGALYMGWEPKGKDIFYDDITEYMQKDKEVVLYNSKEDLYRKTDFYLENEEKRKKLVERGVDKIINNFTYEIILKKVLKEVIDRIK